MTRFEWTPDLVTGNEAIDSQHRMLFTCANQLLDKVAVEDPDVDDASDCIWRLTDYVMQHFADEQELMESVHYPERSIHAGLHDQLTGETMLLTARVMRGEIVLAAEIALLVTRWMRDHILRADKDFVAYLAKHGDRT